MSDPATPPFALDTESGPYSQLRVSNGRPLSLIQNDEQALYGVFSQDGQKAEIWQNSDSGTGDTWECLFVCLYPGFETSSCVRLDGRFYLVGGSSIDLERAQRQVMVYNEENQWQAIPPPPGWSEPRIGLAVTLFNDAIWVAGGYGASGRIYDDVYSYCGRSEQWTRQPALPMTLCNASLAAVNDDDLYLFGGYCEMPGGRAMTDLYRLSGGSWVCQTLPQPLPGPADYWALGSATGESLLLLASFAGKAFTGELIKGDQDWQDRGDGLADVVIQEGLPPFGFATLGYGGLLFLAMTDTEGTSAFAYYSPPGSGPETG